MSLHGRLSLRALTALVLLVCVAAVPFGAGNRVGVASAKTLAFAGELLEVGKSRWAVEGQATLAVGVGHVAASSGVADRLGAAPDAHRTSSGSLAQHSQSEPSEPTMGGATTCPVSHTSCPQQMTLCPRQTTNCPEQATVCVTTQCPTLATVCPEVATTCQLTTCPVIATSCPTTATLCPKIQTLCPAQATSCPQVQTTCPLQFTVCNTLQTKCPTNPTVCENTVCPFVATKCPKRETVCEFTKCNTDAESSCSHMVICQLCGRSYQPGPPAGLYTPSVVTNESMVTTVGPAAPPAPRLAFLP